MAEDGKSLLSCFPSVVGQSVLLRFDGQGNSSLIAPDLKTGQRLWQFEHSRGGPRSIANEVAGGSPVTVYDAHSDLARHIGVARYTTTAAGNKVFARMGSPVTVPTACCAAIGLARDQGFLMVFQFGDAGETAGGFPASAAFERLVVRGHAAVRQRRDLRGDAARRGVAIATLFGGLRTANDTFLSG